MVEKIDGLQMLLTPEESDLFERQADAQSSGTLPKTKVHYQNEPKGDEQCSKCSMFVPGFPDDLGGYCTKVRSFRGPEGIIFEDGWCDKFELDAEDTED